MVARQQLSKLAKTALLCTLLQAVPALSDSPPAGDPDSDGDGVPDSIDNCTFVPNPSQCNTNDDCFGNRCDGDINNDGITNGAGNAVVNAIDLGLFRAVYFTDWPDADFNCDGTVNAIDLGIFRSLYFAPPGPGACPVEDERTSTEPESRDESESQQTQ